MPDLNVLIPQLLASPVGTFLVWVLVLFFGPMAILSEKTAEKFGLLGVAARWFRDAKKRAIKKDEELSELKVSQLREEIAEVDRSAKAQISRANKQIEKLAHEVDRLSEVEIKQHSYIVWVTKLFRDLEVWAASKGLTLPPPPFMTFTEWSLSDNERGSV